MSDPISNDYASVPVLPESIRLRAVKGALKTAKRRNATASEALDFLDMLGLSDAASEVAGRPLTSTPERLSEPSVRRDNLNRIRPALAQSDDNGVPSGQHGHNGRCASGDHAWVEDNIRPASDNHPARCRPCEQRRKRGGSSKAKDGVILCRCPGMKHQLTEGDSESTYVDPRGQRQCRIGIERRRQTATPGPELNPGERLCGCKPERHVLTPFSSETTYVNPSGKRSCKIGRRRSEDARVVAARKGRAA